MSTVAYGLQLHSTFPLLGLQPRSNPGLPELKIALSPPARLQRRWHPSSQAAVEEWQGLLGDGEQLRIQRGAGGDRLFTYGSHACFHLDSAAGELICAPARPGLDWQRTLLGKVLPAVSVMRGYEALHAAAVRGPHGAVALAGPSGIGKTTLAMTLMTRGLPLMCDDVLALSPARAGVSAHCGTAHVNLAEAPVGPVPGLTTIGMLGGERWATVREPSEEACPLAAVVLLERAERLSLRIRRLPASPLPLSPYVLGIAADERRRASRFALYAELAAQVPIYELTAAPHDAPEAIAETIEAALAERDATLALEAV
jgi:hypothetical protein